jgi:hypothetical protein
LPNIPPAVIQALIIALSLALSGPPAASGGMVPAVTALASIRVLILAILQSTVKFGLAVLVPLWQLLLPKPQRVVIKDFTGIKVGPAAVAATVAFWLAWQLKSNN